MAEGQLKTIYSLAVGSVGGLNVFPTAASIMTDHVLDFNRPFF